uniref:RRP15-like protein n=1 Tax=Picea sitchensis TaxID=3332 RepID=A9NSK7_PICSI|nr:unknown [Picea sitchensis]
MAEQEVAVLSPQKRRAENITADKSIKKTKMTDISQEVNPKQASDSYEEENINGNSEEDEYSFGEEDDEVSDDCEEDEPSRSPRQEENDGSRSIIAEKKEEEEEGYAGSSEDESSGSDGETRVVQFAEGSNGFRAAFSRIMEKKVADDALGPVLSAHKKLIAKKLDEEAEFKVKSEAKKEKRLLREKGHVKPEIFFDAKEKSLIRLATKGVVKLFNAVSKAQSVQASFDVSKAKDAKAARKESKAAFLSELRRENRPNSFKPGQFSSIKAHSIPVMEAKNGQKDATNESGWAALRDDFMLTSSKLKDWDKMQDTAAVDEMPVGHIDTDVSSSDED